MCVIGNSFSFSVSFATCISHFIKTLMKSKYGFVVKVRVRVGNLTKVAISDVAMQILIVFMDVM